MCIHITTPFPGVWGVSIEYVNSDIKLKPLSHVMK